MTSTRLATLLAVQEYPHSSAEQVSTLVRERLGTASKQAVYDVLHALTEKGIIRHVNLAGRASLYEMETADNHHHFLCVDCGKLRDVPCAVAVEPCMTPPESSDYHVITADVVYKGMCASCLATREAAQAR